MVVDTLTNCGLLHSVCDLKAPEINIQSSLIWEGMFYKFELGQNAAEATKNICHAKGEGKVDHNTLMRWFKKFRSGCKNLNNQVLSAWLKTVP